MKHSKRIICQLRFASPRKSKKLIGKAWRNNPPKCFLLRYRGALRGQGKT